MFSIPLCTHVMMKVGGCFSFSCWHIFILMEHTIPTDIHCIQEGGGAQVVFPLWLFVCFALLNFSHFPPLLKEKYGFSCTRPHSLNLLNEMVHPVDVFQDFFSKWTYLSFLLYDLYNNPEADLKIQHKAWSAICGSKIEFRSDLKTQYKKRSVLST